MPAPLAVDAPTASGLITRVFPRTLWLEPRDAVALLRRLGVAHQHIIVAMLTHHADHAHP